jgi:hypothetical protein
MLQGWRIVAILLKIDERTGPLHVIRGDCSRRCPAHKSDVAQQERDVYNNQAACACKGKIISVNDAGCSIEQQILRPDDVQSMTVREGPEPETTTRLKMVLPMMETLQLPVDAWRTGGSVTLRIECAAVASSTQDLSVPHESTTVMAVSSRKTKAT